MTFRASYTTRDGESHEAREILVAEGIDESQTIRKAVWLVRYADALRNSIKNNTTRELRDIQSAMETYADVIGADDAQMRSQERRVIDAAIDLIDEQRRSVDDNRDRPDGRRDGDFWQE